MNRLWRSTASQIRYFHATSRLAAKPISQVDSAPSSDLDITAFRNRAFDPEKPLHIIQNGPRISHMILASSTWFHENSPNHWTLSDHLTEHEDWPFPYEVVMPPGDTLQAATGFRDWLLQSGDFKDLILAGSLQPILEGSEGQTFFQLQAPLRLLQRAIEYNTSQNQYLQLYIAQSSLSELPESLKEDLPPPHYVLKAGKGDIYASSIWLGTEPTFTPLHRDPNPNLFHQLHSSKLVRLLPPQVGEMLFFEVQARIRQQGVSSRIRAAAEMMEGLERKVLGDAIWGQDVELEEMREAKVEKGDSLFIPKGWWHSIKSVGDQGALNGSVNWWFR